MSDSDTTQTDTPVAQPGRKFSDAAPRILETGRSGCNEQVEWTLAPYWSSSEDEPRVRYLRIPSDNSILILEPGSLVTTSTCILIH